MRVGALVGVCVFLCGAAADAAPPVGTWFEYEFERAVGDGSGEYTGYSDELESRGRYEVIASGPDLVRVRATYTWSFASNDGKTEAGQEDRTIEFRPSDRRYVGPRTDLDEWDEKDATQLAVWFWIPPDVQVGQSVPILDEPYLVVRRDATVRVDGRACQAIEVRAQGTDRRNDDYGVFGFEFADTYYFDPTTGIVLGERYRERDTGEYQGRSAAFELTETLEVGATSFPTAADVGAEVGMWGARAGVVAAGLALLIGVPLLWRRRPRRVVREDGTSGLVRHVRSRDLPLPVPAPGVTTFFTPFLDDFARKALLAKDGVAIARSADGAMIGIGFYDRQAMIGTILAPEPEVAEGLRRHLAAADFFAEVRHPIPKRFRDQAAASGVGLPAVHSFNLFETYQVLELQPVPTPPYDTALVTRLAPADLPAVTRIAQEVYRVPADRWLGAQIDGGDFGFVARLNGAIVGFALATLIGDQGRVHTLTVLREHRGKGIGKELMRARLRALSDLGAARVITEIADANLASLAVARSFGFEAVGSLYVETSRTVREPRVIVRRF